MTRLVHLTDLHFGHERADLVQPLMAAIRCAEPDLVVVSGDLTHRARAAQFRAARAFLHALDLPFLATPGNHDMPLINLPLRILAPFRPWRRGVAQGLTPRLRIGCAHIATANTADPWRWRRGILRRADQRQVADFMRARPHEAIGVLACHHPLREPAGFDRGETKGARAGLPALAQAGVQVVLSGHLHHWDVGLGITADQPQPVLMVQSGTALCGRDGERHHGFAVLDLTPGQAKVTPWLVDEARRMFVPQDRRVFLRQDGLWHLSPQP